MCLPVEVMRVRGVMGAEAYDDPTWHLQNCSPRCEVPIRQHSPIGRFVIGSVVVVGVVALAHKPCSSSSWAHTAWQARY
jgi:hypothetical protein